MNSPRILAVKYNKNNMFESSPYDATTITVTFYQSLCYILYIYFEMDVMREDCFQARDGLLKF